MQDIYDLDRPIWGATAIGEVIGRGKRATFHLLEAGHLDASRIGGRWVSTRRRLLRGIVGERGERAG